MHELYFYKQISVSVDIFEVYLCRKPKAIKLEFEFVIIL